MLYILLIIIILLLVTIIYSLRDKGAKFNKLFSPIEGLKNFEKNDIRNSTHQEEYIKFQGFRYMTRHEALKEAERLENLFHFLDEEDRYNMVYKNIAPNNKEK